MQRLYSCVLACCLLPCLAGEVAAQLPTTRPLEGIRQNTPQVHAIRAGRIVVAPDEQIENGTLVIRNGVVEAVGRDVPIPPDARIWSFTDRVIYPAFIDAFHEVDVPLPKPEVGAAYWNSDVRPRALVSAAYKFSSERNSALRANGFALQLVAPKTGVIKGRSALLTAADVDPTRQVINADVALHVKLTIPIAPHREHFPNSPMGAVALARQAFYDAHWYTRAWSAYRANPRLSRPETNASLETLAVYGGANGLVIADAVNELFFLRADAFAREFHLNMAVRGSGKEYRRLDAIAETARPVILPVNFPLPPNVHSATDEVKVTLETLLHWDLAPENPARVAAAGIPFALTTHGLKSVDDVWENWRLAVKRGIEKDAALEALTETPARLFGVADSVGTLRRGMSAHFTVTDGDIFEAGTKILETWIDGQRYEVVSQRDQRLVGTWQADNWQLEINRLKQKLQGTVIKGDKETELQHVTTDGLRLEAVFSSTPFDKQGLARMSLSLDDVDHKRPSAAGFVVWGDGETTSLTLTRRSTRSAADENDHDAETTKREPSSFPVNFPLGAYGRSAAPEQQSVLFTNATVWTAGPQGILDNADVLVADGKIIRVGKRLRAPRGTRVVDATGSHITPGIVDCHSHIATDGGINESSQAITAEVRIGDTIDSDDIDIYRQLAGGVTTINVLHGSANPIGGQNQVLKLRWGALPEAMKFREAPPGIKFALGENVKQSNWGDEFTERYPQTRMGVEQIMRDAFHAARQYRQDWDRWQETRQGLPPRYDLELEAIAEVAAGQRWIHCHSYRQDEILALIRTLDDFDITIGTFQHVLEGYKVADALAKHGAMASAFADWWGYKFEVFDAIPYNGALMHESGVVVSFNSDDRELARHLNHEAAKAMKYGGVPPDQAIKSTTLNPARQLRIEQYVGSLEPGKHADLVVWSGSPLSIYSLCEQTWIDGRCYFDRSEDVAASDRIREMRNTIIQKILASGQKPARDVEPDEDESELWPRADLFCHGHDQ